jgi:hypothetical protein
MNLLTENRVSYPAHDSLNDLIANSTPKGTKAMLLYEDLARERRREAERVAREERLGRQLNSVRRWERLAGWVNRRARRANAVL